MDGEFDEVIELGEFENLTISQLDNFIERLRELRNEKFDKEYKVIRVSNSNGNISATIKDETGFHTQYHPVTQTFTGYIGSISIIIPRDKWTNDLEKKIKERYDR